MKTKILTSILPDLGFNHTWHVHGRTSIADLIPVHRRCGIYVLQFLNGDVYVGQSVDIARRFHQHRVTRDDIDYINFKPSRKNHLDEEEQIAIRRLEKDGFRLRNITFTNVLSGDTDFDLVMPENEQTRWVNDIASVDVSGARTSDDELRLKYWPKYQRFLQQPFAEEALNALKIYVQHCIPIPIKSELSFWASSCMPGPHKHGIVVYSRININWQEVFTVLRDTNGLAFSWHLAMSSLAERYGPSLNALFRQYSGLEQYNHQYVPGGQDQINLFTDNTTEAMALLNDHSMIKAMRQFNMRLMRKGPCPYSRYHCFDLADHLVTG